MLIDLFGKVTWRAPNWESQGLKCLFTPSRISFSKHWDRFAATDYRLCLSYAWMQNSILSNPSLLCVCVCVEGGRGKEEEGEAEGRREGGLPDSWIFDLAQFSVVPVDCRTACPALRVPFRTWLLVSCSWLVVSIWTLQHCSQAWSLQLPPGTSMVHYLINTDSSSAHFWNLLNSTATFPLYSLCYLHICI